MLFRIRKLKILAYSCLGAGIVSAALLRDPFLVGISFGYFYFMWLVKDMNRVLEEEDYEKITARIVRIHDNSMTQKVKNRVLNTVEIEIEDEDHQIYSFRILKKDIFKKLVREPDLEEGMLCDAFFTKETSLSLQERLITISAAVTMDANQKKQS